MLRLISLLVLGALCHAAAAQTIYKCDSGGKLTYGDQPCTAGTASELAVPAAPAPDPGLQQRLKRQKAMVEQLDKERLASAALQERERARNARLGAARRQQCDRLRLRKKWADEDLARAGGKEAMPLRIKAQRQAEQLALECPA